MSAGAAAEAQSPIGSEGSSGSCWRGQMTFHFVQRTQEGEHRLISWLKEQHAGLSLEAAHGEQRHGGGADGVARELEQRAAGVASWAT